MRGHLQMMIMVHSCGAVGWSGLSPLETGTAVIPISQGNLISCVGHKQGAVEYQDLNPGSLAEPLRLGQFYCISHRGGERDLRNPR